MWLAHEIPSVKIVLYNIHITVKCQNVSSQVSLTIRCIFNSGQLQCILMVSGPRTFLGDRLKVVISSKS